MGDNEEAKVKSGEAIHLEKRVIPPSELASNASEEPPTKKVKTESIVAVQSNDPSDGNDETAESVTHEGLVRVGDPQVVAKEEPVDIKNESILGQTTVAPAGVGQATPLAAKEAEDEDEEDLFETADDDPSFVTGNANKIESDSTLEAVATRGDEPAPANDATGEVPLVAVGAGSESTKEGERQIDESSVDAAQPTVKPETAIPRKGGAFTAKNSTSGTLLSSPTAQASPVSGSNARTPGTRYGLPPGVNVPASIVRSKLLEVEMNTPGSKLMDVLKSLPVNLINDALTEYDDAVEIKGAAAIRNHGAYLYGVVKRYVSVHERALAGEGTGILPMGEGGLTPMVQIRLEQLVSTGFCTTQEMNEKVKSKIRMLSEKDALFALDELSSVDRSSIRSFGSYFMGILNRYMRGNANAPLSNKNRSDKGLGHYPQPSSQQQHQFDRNRERDRFAPSRDNIRTNTGTSSSSFRDQSRDRFDDRRDFGGNGSAHRSNEGHSASVMNNPMYDNRPQQQMPQQQPQAWQNQNFAHPPMQPQPMGAVGYGNYGASGPAPHMNNSMQPQGPPVNQGGMQPPGVNLNFAIPQQQPYYPQQQSQQQPPYMPQSQSFVQQAGYPPNPQQGVQSNTNVQYQQSHMGNMMGQQQQSAFGGNPSTPQSYMQQPMSTMNQQQPFVSNHLAAQQPGWRQPQEPPQLSIDILGLADKAASAIQALGANKLNNPMGQGYTPQLQHGGPSPPQQGYSSYGPMNQGQPSLLGMQQQAQQFPSQQQQQYPPHHQHQHIAHNSLGRNTDAGSQQAGRRRTTATLTELPVTVQYAVQNLVATGAIDGSPDEGIMGMIFDLPEHMALTALQKFASIDKSSMRNKTAYLAGVLRRELEKIHRR